MDECVRFLDHAPERTPTGGTFELTVRCNLHCKMCMFRHDDSENAEIVAKELTAAQWIDMARQVADAGTLQLLVTGGEPLLRPDFCEIWEGVYKQGFVITLYTNATLVTPKIMETLRKCPPHRIGVTVYGSCPAIYEKVTGSAAAFEKALDGIRLLRTLPSQMEYRMTIIQDNFCDYDAVEELLRREFDPDIELVTTRIVTKAVRGACADVESCRIAPEKNIEISYKRTLKQIKKDVGDRFERGNILVEMKAHCRDPAEKTEVSLFGCSAGMSTYTVSWDGRLLGCQVMEAFSREIREDFSRAWMEFPFGIELPELSEKCRDCSIGAMCSLCPAFRYAETNTFSEAPAYICADTEAVTRLVKNYKPRPLKGDQNESIW